MELKHGFISADDHVQEHPDVWKSRMSRQKWGDRIPHIAAQPDGSESWVVDGRPISLPGIAAAGALMGDLAQDFRWRDVPRTAYCAADRLRAMDIDRIDYSILYPTVAGLAGERFATITDPDLELACVQAYND